MTKRNKELLRLYQRERARGFQAKWALSNASTRLEWDKHEVAEYSSGEPIDPKRGHVRLRVVPDETCSFEDLEGDCFNPKANPNIPASRLQRDREEFIAKVNREGVWRIVSEYCDGEVWQHEDSCFGFVGEDWRHSGYDTDIMRATLDAAKDARVHVMKKPDINRVLLQTLREELAALRTWQRAPKLAGDLAEGVAISISKVEAAIRVAERNK